jgi:hypothetical protein
MASIRAEKTKKMAGVHRTEDEFALRANSAGENAWSCLNFNEALTYAAGGGHLEAMRRVREVQNAEKNRKNMEAMMADARREEKQEEKFWEEMRSYTAEKFDKAMFQALAPGGRMIWGMLRQPPQERERRRRPAWQRDEDWMEAMGAVKSLFDD